MDVEAKKTGSKHPALQSVGRFSHLQSLHSQLKQKPETPTSHGIIHALALANDRTLYMLATVEFLVETLQHESQDRGGNDGHDGCADVEAHCEGVLWLDLISQHC